MLWALLYGSKNSLSIFTQWWEISDQVCWLCLIRSQVTATDCLNVSFLPLVGVISTHISQIVTITCKNNFENKCSSTCIGLNYKYKLSQKLAVESQEYTQCNTTGFKWCLIWTVKNPKYLKRFDMPHKLVYHYPDCSCTKLMCLTSH